MNIKQLKLWKQELEDELYNQEAEVEAAQEFDETRYDEDTEGEIYGRIYTLNQRIEIIDKLIKKTKKR